jgi:hypothetical protein
MECDTQDMYVLHMCACRCMHGGEGGGQITRHFPYPLLCTSQHTRHKTCPLHSDTCLYTKICIAIWRIIVCFPHILAAVLVWISPSCRLSHSGFTHILAVVLVWVSPGSRLSYSGFSHILTVVLVWVSPGNRLSYSGFSHILTVVLVWVSPRQEVVLQRVFPYPNSGTSLDFPRQ